VELQVGMVFALETSCPASDWSSSPPTAPDPTLFPSQDLVVADPY
jgi:hypothetical protein